MKTRLLIIVVIGIIGLSSFGFVENVFGWGISPIDTGKHSEFIDYQDIYQKGLPIQFIIENTSYTGCGSFNAKISDRDANIIWEEIVYALCDPPNDILRTYEIKIGYNDDHPLIINESGKYYIEVEYDTSMTKREFKVRQNIAGDTLDRTVYGHPYVNDDSLLDNLEKNQLPIGQGIYMNFAFFLVVLGGIIIGIIFVIRRKRK